jgi:hypothetical protein
LLTPLPHDLANLAVPEDTFSLSSVDPMSPLPRPRAVRHGRAGKTHPDPHLCHCSPLLPSSPCCATGLPTSPRHPQMPPTLPRPSRPLQLQRRLRPRPRPGHHRAPTSRAYKKLPNLAMEFTPPPETSQTRSQAPSPSCSIPPSTPLRRTPPLAPANLTTSRATAGQK